MPSTITLGGLPLDATVRELKNFCRLCPGFEAASATLRPGRPPLLFVKFFTEDLASQAILQLQQLCFDEDRDPMTLIRAEFARKELSANLLLSNGGLKDDGFLARSAGPPAKRVRQEEHFDSVPSYGIDTLACRLDQDDGQIQQFFEQLPGFIAFRLNPQSTNCFAKFSSPAYAHRALENARIQGFVVDFAKKNLDEGPSQMNVPAGLGHSYFPSAPTVEAVPTGSTLACRKDHDYDTYHSFFVMFQGFETLRYPSAGGSCFVKFANTALAQEALDAARDAGFSAEFARRELDESGPQGQHPQPIIPLAPPPVHGYAPPSANAGYAPAGSTRTLAIKFDGHFDQDYAKKFFTVLPGFEAIKVAVTGGNCFVRYSDHARAQNALYKAQHAGFTLDFARRELEEPGVSTPAPVAAQPTGPRMPVCNTLACKIEIHTEEAIKGYFAQCTGFERMKVNAAGSNCFVKFCDQFYAQEALNVAKLDGFVVDFAKRELEENIGNSDWGGVSASATMAPQTGSDGRISTLACKTNDLGEKHIHNFFGNMEGFEALRLAASGRVCFLKFSDPVLAETAMTEGRHVGLIIEFAKRELDNSL